MSLSPARLLTSCAGLGFLPVAPGTWGSAGGALAYWLALRHIPVGGQLAVIAVLCVAGAAATDRVEREVGTSDPGEVVVDELVGVWITLLAVGSLVGVAVGFLLFRALDIWKPWPARWAERRVSGGWGVMLDDVIAGGYAWLVLSVSAAWVAWW